MVGAERPGRPTRVLVAAFLAAGHQQGVNRLVILSSHELQFFAYRIAHLVGASTAGGSKGLVPFFGHLSYPIETLQKNCLVVILRTQNPANDFLRIAAINPA